jgi:hypothetical protein
MAFKFLSKMTYALSFYRSQYVLCLSKFFEPFHYLTAFSASSKPFVPAQKPILRNANHLFVCHKMFVTATICKYIYALSFYRSQNVLCRSNFFVPDQKFIHILCQSQTFCARQKDDLRSVKLVFVPAQKFWKRH